MQGRSRYRQTTIASSSQVHEFKKGIKWDSGAFTGLKENKSQALAQDVSEILDSTYKPSNKQETECFEEKQK